MRPEIRIARVTVRDPGVVALLDALTAELAAAGYAAEETFGYSADQIEQADVHLVGAIVAGDVVGVGGLEVQGSAGELKRFYVTAARRGSGVADAIMVALLALARERGIRTLRLETGDKQHAAMAFYRRHGFADVPRFGPYVDSATSVCMALSVGTTQD